MDNNRKKAKIQEIIKTEEKLDLIFVNNNTSDKNNSKRPVNAAAATAAPVTPEATIRIKG